MNSAAAYLGKTAVVQHEVATLHATGANWEYRNYVSTSRINLNVRDMDDKLIFTSAGESGLGMQKFHWNGLDMNGNPVAEGPYKLEIDAENNEGKPIEVTSFIKDVITSIDTQGAEPVYTVGSVPVGVRGILALSNEG